jgi:uncharacterized protein (TIGR02996 family)
MTTPALRRAWKDWCSFADRLDLSDGSPDCTTLHGRLFRLSGGHPLDAGELRSTRDAVRAAFEPWLAEGVSEPAGNRGLTPPAHLEQLRQAMTACEPGWRALLRTRGRRPTDWGEVQRVALTAGLPRPTEPFWTSPLIVTHRRFDLLSGLQGRDHAESLALLDALLRVLNHPSGRPLFDWARKTSSLTRVGEALRAAAVFRDAAAAGALQQEWLAPLGWVRLVETLLRLCQDVTLHLLLRLNEPVPMTERVAARPRRGRSRKIAAAGAATYRRPVPEPLPVEPYFREIRGSEAFLRAIAEEPLEDLHRLAFADWLEEHGHAERGQFIRLQCRHDRLPDYPLARRRLAEEIAALFRAHGAAWTAGLPNCKPVEWHDLDNFRGGLLEHLTLGQYIEEKDRVGLFQAVDVRSLRTRLGAWTYNLGPPALATFLAAPWLPRLVSLEIEVPWYSDSLAVLGGADVLTGLVHLGMVDSVYNPARLTELVEGLRLPALSSLDLSENRLDEEGAVILAGSAVLGKLRRLRLSSCRLGVSGIRTLASSPALAGLEHLDVSGGFFREAGAEALAASPFLTNLSTLVMSQCGDRGAEAVVSSPFLKRLTCISLRDTHLRNEGAQALAESANLASLTVLDLGGNYRIETGGVQALVNSPHLGNLRALSLSGVPLPLESVEALAQSPHLANLETLDLSDTGLDAPSAKALVASPYLNNLAVLDVTQRSRPLPPSAKGAIRKRWKFAQM